MTTSNLETKIFLDSGSPEETKKSLDTLGFLDGQTTNPTLIAKHEVEEGIKKITEPEAIQFYKESVCEISKLIPNGSVSIEVFSDLNTTKEKMLTQANEMFSWIPNAHIKFPCTISGLSAAEVFLENGGRVNITLCFSQEQAAAVFVALKNSTSGQAFLSPFIGRIDDVGENGMDVLKNIIRMKEECSSKVEILAASIRSVDHLLASISLKSDIVTVPLKIIEEWKSYNFSIPKDFVYNSELTRVPYRSLDLSKSFTSFNLFHELTKKGLEKFNQDWNKVVLDPKAKID